MEKIIFYLGLICLTANSCEEATTKSNVKQYYVRVYTDFKGSRIDTIESNGISHHTEKDSLYFKKEIIFNGKIHQLSKYSNIHNAPTDGAHIHYELDKLGVIFYSSLNWKSRKKLYSSNDSINTIISYCLEEALVDSEIDNMKMFEKFGKKRRIVLR